MWWRYITYTCTCPTSPSLAPTNEKLVRRLVNRILNKRIITVVLSVFSTVVHVGFKIFQMV